MTITDDLYYIQQIGHRLDKFRQKRNTLYEFRCPICGDSQKSKSKTRGFFYRHPKVNRMAFRCHNCGASMMLSTFLKTEFPETYAEYAFNTYTENNAGKQGAPIPMRDVEKELQKRLGGDNILSGGAERIRNLDKDHAAYRYLIQRKIPQSEFSQLFYTDNYKKFVSYFGIDTTNMPTTGRIVIPFYDGLHNLMGFQGRSMPWNSHETRYITFKLQESFPKIYGLHKLPKKNKNNDVLYVSEGPFDSLFLHPSVAMMGADIDSETIQQITGYNKLVYVYDNEPRNGDIAKRMEKVVKEGHSVVIWPKNIIQKDINDMVLSGKTVEDIMNIIERSTVRGMKAEYLVRNWKN